MCSRAPGPPPSRRRPSSSSAARLERLVHLTHLHFLFEVVPLVEAFLAGAKGNLDLDQGPLEIHPERDESLSPGIHREGDFPDVVPMQEELSNALGIVVVDVPERIGLDMRPVEPELVLLHTAEGVADLGLSRSDRLDLGSVKLDPSLKTLPDFVVPEGLGVADLLVPRVVLIWTGHERRLGDRRRTAPLQAGLRPAQ